MANRTRNIVLRVPVTAEERAMIERKMQQMGTGCFSVYARKMLIDGYVIRLDYSDVKAMTAELQKIGTNINQIAKRVNATGMRRTLRTSRGRWRRYGNYKDPSYQKHLEKSH